MYPRVTHPFATGPSRYCYLNGPVRLACLIHAASVRSEPESNSPNRKLIPLSKRLAAPCGAAIVLQRKIDMNKAFLKRLCSARYLSSRAAHNLAFSFFTKVTCFCRLQNESETRLMQLNSWPDIFKDLFPVKRLRFSRATLFWAGGEYRWHFRDVNHFRQSFFKIHPLAPFRLPESLWKAMWLMGISVRMMI